MTTMQLYYFVSVAETLSFTKAAKEHYVAQTAISQQIASLERELDVALFKRTTRSVSLTEAGMSFYKDVKNLLSQLEVSTLKAKHLNLGSNGFLNLGIPGKSGMKFLTNMLRGYREKYPGVGLALHMESNYTLQNMLRRDILDMVLTFSKYPEQLREDLGACWVTLDSFPLCIVIASDHPLASRSSVTWEEIKSERLLSGPQYGAEARYIKEVSPDYSIYSDYEEEAPPEPYTLDKRIYSDDALLMLIEAGYGCGVLPSFVRSQYEESPVFVRIDDDKNIPHLMIGWRKDSANPVVPIFLREFRDFYVRYNPRFDPTELDRHLPAK